MVRLNGLVWLVLICLMIGVAAYLNWQINWWYTVIAGVIYTTGSFILISAKEDSTPVAPNEIDIVFRLSLSCHLSFLLWTMGLLIPFSKQLMINTAPLMIPYIPAWMSYVGWFSGVAVVLAFIENAIFYKIYGSDNNEGLFITVFITTLALIVILTTQHIIVGYFMVSILAGLLLPFLLFNTKNSITLQGIGCIVLIVLMLGVAYYHNWSIDWWFLVISSILYSGVIAYITLLSGAEKTTTDKATKVTKTEIIQIDRRIWSTCHLSACFFVGSLFLNYQNGIEWLLGLGSIFAGFALSFILVKKN